MRIQTINTIVTDDILHTPACEALDLVYANKHLLTAIILNLYTICCQSCVFSGSKAANGEVPTTPPRQQSEVVLLSQQPLLQVCEKMKSIKRLTPINSRPGL